MHFSITQEGLVQDFMSKVWPVALVQAWAFTGLGVWCTPSLLIVHVLQRNASRVGSAFTGWGRVRVRGRTSSTPSGLRAVSKHDAADALRDPPAPCNNS